MQMISAFFEYQYQDVSLVYAVVITSSHSDEAAVFHQLEILIFLFFYLISLRIYHASFGLLWFA